MDYTIKIGGEAGQGILTIGDTLARFFARSGYHVFTHQDYESRIRGGHNIYQVRVSDRPVMSSRTGIDILVVLDAATIPMHEEELSPDGLALYDAASLKQKHDKPNFLDVPFMQLAMEQTSNRIMANTVATGAVLGMLGVPTDALEGIIRDLFKKDDLIAANLKAAAAGYGYAKEHCIRCAFLAADAARPKMLIQGNDAIGLGALASGLQFYSAYPMTPSTSIMLSVAARAKEYGVIVEQAEDEIAAINMALGASYAGVRAMTGSSGGGFALMVEGLSLAAITETPIVIGLVQRPGPATGLPTKTEQADLNFALYSAHGEFPRVLLAPGTPEQAFFLTNKAFDLAEKYQIPVLILSDQYLADTQWTFDGFDASRLISNDYRLRGEAFAAIPSYQRHVYTKTGVSPMATPGDGPHVVITDSDEHNETGNLIEDAGTRKRMMEKRLFRKLPLIQAEIAPPALYGHHTPDVVLVGWGSTFGLLKEAVDALNVSCLAAMLHFSEVYPLPLLARLDYLALLRSAKQTICIENNATNQFARLLKTETGYAFNHLITKYDGRPFLLEELIGEINAKLG
ncbi:MAG: 2-oxoglutarate ferredoxin oxidoreductase subunit alpha [Nitrospirae bacterium]|nr:MAG: 2-oxoglutarate ferredoxin oxidoreductase subunit alpha [Nitrospirota bacterium]